MEFRCVLGVWKSLHFIENVYTRPTIVSCCCPHNSNRCHFPLPTADKGHYVNFRRRGNPRRCWRCANHPGAGRRRPTVCPESAKIARNRWGSRRQFGPFLRLRWDEAAAFGDVAPLPRCRSGRRQAPRLVPVELLADDLPSEWLAQIHLLSCCRAGGFVCVGKAGAGTQAGAVRRRQPHRVKRR